jgi:predicted small lipoprotein YifL
MEDLVQDDGVGGRIAKWKRAYVALPQFPPALSIELRPGEAKHFWTAVNANRVVGFRAKQLDHASGARANINQPPNRSAKHGLHTVFHCTVGDMKRPDRIPLVGMLDEILSRRRGTISANSSKACCVGSGPVIAFISFGSIKQREEWQSKGRRCGGEENPAPFLAANGESRINEDADMARNARLALAENLRKLTHRELHRAQQSHNPEACRIGKRAEDVDNRNHALTYKDFFICGQLAWCGLLLPRVGQPYISRTTGAMSRRRAVALAVFLEREVHMKKTIALAAVLAASMALTACGKKAADETAEAANAVMSDVNATATDAMNTVDAATDNAMGAVANTADAAGNKIESAADKMKAATGDAMSTAGNKMEAAGDAMKK